MMNKPEWLNKKVKLSDCREIKKLLRELKLHTICEESLCPNISECFSSKTATFLILGDTCTRQCGFCGMSKNLPKAVDCFEPQRIKKAVEILNLQYVVITSPTRDDLADGGADMFSRTVREIKSLPSLPKVELLIPDFSGNYEALHKVTRSGADVIAHNIETVPALYFQVCKGADYRRSLDVLKIVGIGRDRALLKIKSGMMLGLGEKKDEVIKVFEDLRKVDCDFLTLGQYLPPSASHYSLKEYVSPEDFLFFERQALAMGFKGVNSAPYVRSSYLAHTFLLGK